MSLPTAWVRVLSTLRPESDPVTVCEGQPPTAPRQLFSVPSGTVSSRSSSCTEQSTRPLSPLNERDSCPLAPSWYYFRSPGKELFPPLVAAGSESSFTRFSWPSYHSEHRGFERPSLQLRPPRNREPGDRRRERPGNLAPNL